MDNKKIFSWIGIFLVGVIVGGLVFYLVCCKCNKSCKYEYEMRTSTESGDKDILPPGVRKISVDTANAYFKCYMKNPRSIDKLVAFTVSKEQFLAMQTLKDSDTAVNGFRIYFGEYGDPVPVNMVVGTDAEGDDITENIYKTTYSDPCPDLCDEESEIVTPD